VLEALYTLIIQIALLLRSISHDNVRTPITTEVLYMITRSIALGLLVMLSWHIQAENPYTPAESRLIREQCIELGTKYAHYLDSGQGARVAAVFDEQGSWQGGSSKFVGRENIRIAFAGRPKTRRTIHLVSNHQVEILSRNLAVVESHFVLYRTEVGSGVVPLDDQPVRVGRYHDECVRSESGWLLQSRRMEEVFGKPAK